MIDLEAFSLPLSRPLETAAARIDTREGFLVRTEIDGIAGVGEATPLAGWTESLAECEDALESIDDPETALRERRLTGAPAARHGVSLAVLDARARAAGVALYEHLGRTERIERVPVNATVGDAPPADTVDAARDAVEAGYPAVKLKVGARTLTADLARIEAVREACPDVELRADANGAWEPAVAERALSRCAVHGVAFVEQPLAADELEGHAALRGGDIGVAIDEGIGQHGIDAVLEAEAADVVVIKPMVLGGVDVSRTAAKRAQKRGVDVVVTTTIDGAIARAGAVHLAASLPGVFASGLATGEWLASDLLAGVAEIRAGSALVPQRKGNIGPP